MTLIAYILRLLKVPFTNKNLRGIFWTHPDRDNLLGYARILSYYGIKINAKIIDSLDSIDNKTIMEAKIEKISELSKLLSVKTRMSDDLFHLFGKFGIGHLLSRLSLENRTEFRLWN